MDMNSLPSIPDYFKGKNIFITGGSGFLGKILIEKLLYSCPDLNTIYLLMRIKKNVMPMDRIMDLYKLPCFDRLRTKRPGLFECKVKFIAGDVGEPCLGMSEEDQNLIVNNTNIIFHSAASIRFNDHLAKAVKMNLKGTKELIELAQQMQNLEELKILEWQPLKESLPSLDERTVKVAGSKWIVVEDLLFHYSISFVHISTAFSSCYRTVIDEVLYPPIGDWRTILEVCESLDSHTLQVLTSKIIGDIPNTYIFTKHLTEYMIQEHKGKLPIVIYRPSIVLPTIDEPMPGWIDNFNGPAGLFVAFYSGIVRTHLMSKESMLDLIPADTIIKGSIIAAWNRGTMKLQVTDDIPIYNACNSGASQLRMKGMLHVGKDSCRNYPVGKMLWLPGMYYSTNVYLYYMRVFFLHLLPAFFIDTLLRIFRIKPFLVKMQRRIFIASIALSPFMKKQWNFTNKNFQELSLLVQEKDRSGFYYDLYRIDLFKYCLDIIKGMKKYLLKEKDEDLDKYKRNYRRIEILDKILKFIFYGCLLWYVFNKLYKMFIFYN